MPMPPHKLRTVKRALHLVWQGAPGWTLASILLMPVQAGLGTLPIYLNKLVVDSVVLGLGSASRSAGFWRVAFYIGLQVGVAWVDSLVSGVAALIQDAQTALVTDYVNDRVHGKSVEVDLEYYENAHYYDTLRRAQYQASYRPVNMVRNLLSAGESAFALLALVGLLISLHWAVALLLVVSTVPGALIRIRYSNLMHGWQRETTPTERRSYYYDGLMTDENTAKEIRVFDLGSLFLQRARALHVQLRREKLSLQARSTLANTAAQVGADLALYGSHAFAAYRTLQGAISLGGLTMYFGAFQRAHWQLHSLLGSVADLYDSSLFLSDLDEFLTLPQRIQEPAAPRKVLHPIQTGIRFESVGFTYPNSCDAVLEDVSLVIRPGEMVALVGENGSGKTTLTKLLCRLYDPTHGRITLDGVDLRDFATVDLRREISILFQEYEHYQLPARENIWLGNAALPPDPERIRYAAERAGADAVIASLKEGYETVLGKMFEGGAELSIGQWQKIALARAFLRDAQIIVLDEPTSALDARAEYEFFRDFRKLARGCSTVLISHRFSTVRMADCIYVLEAGKIVESGSHDDLMRRNGKYACLFEMQAQHYR